MQETDIVFGRPTAEAAKSSSVDIIQLTKLRYGRRENERENPVGRR